MMRLPIFRWRPCMYVLYVLYLTIFLLCAHFKLLLFVSQTHLDKYELLFSCCIVWLCGSRKAYHWPLFSGACLWCIAHLSWHTHKRHRQTHTRTTSSNACHPTFVQSLFVCQLDFVSSYCCVCGSGGGGGELPLYYIICQFTQYHPAPHIVTFVYFHYIPLKSQWTRAELQTIF